MILKLSRFMRYSFKKIPLYSFSNNQEEDSYGIKFDE